MPKNNAYHVYIKRLDTSAEIGFILATGERGYSMAVMGADSLAPVTSEGEMQYGDFLNVSLFAQSDWAGNHDYQSNLTDGPSGIKYWKPQQSYSTLLATASYYRSRNIDATSEPGELSLLSGATLMSNFPDPEGTISCWQYYDGKVYVGLSSSPKIYYTDDFGTTWTLLINLATDFRSAIAAMEEIVDIWWDSNGVMGATLFFAAKLTDNSAGYMLRYSTDKSPRDQVKTDNYGGTPRSFYSDTTIIKIAPEADSGNYSGISNSKTTAYVVCNSIGDGISWAAGSATSYIKVAENIFFEGMSFNIQDTQSDWHDRVVTSINNIGGGFDVLTLNLPIKYKISSFIFSGAGLNDMTTGGNYGGIALKNYEVEIGNLNGTITDIGNYDYVIPGTVMVTSDYHGLVTGNSVTISGTTDYNGTYTITKKTTHTFYITHVWVSHQSGTWALSGVDTFRWSDTGGSSWNSSNVEITGAAQALNDGVEITFGSTTGHTTGNLWMFTVIPDGFNNTDDTQIKNRITTATPTKFYVGDDVEIDNGVTTHSGYVIGINTGGYVYLSEGAAQDFGVGAGTFTISRSALNGIPVEVNTSSPCQGIYVSIDDKVLRVRYSYNGNNDNFEDNTKSVIPEWCINANGYSTSFMPAGMGSHIDARKYVLLTTSYAYPSAAVGTALVFEKLTSLQCSGVPVGGRLFSAGNFIAISIYGNNMLTSYYIDISDYVQYSAGGADYDAASNGIGAVNPSDTQTTLNVKPNKIHQATVTGGSLSTGDIIIATQKVPLAVDSAIYYVDGMTGSSTKPFGADFPSSAAVKDITQDSAGSIHSIISPEGKHWVSDSSGNHTLKYTLPTFDNGETYPEAIEFWNGSVWYANPFDTTVYEYDVATDTVSPLFGLDVTSVTSLRFPTILGAGSYLFIESNESQKTFRYDESVIADSGWLESSDYDGLIPTIQKNWLYAKVTTAKLLTDATAKIRLQVSFDTGVTWYYLSNTLGTAWSAAPADFTLYESGLTQAAINHTFYFPYGSKNEKCMYRINLIKGATENPIVTNISLHYNIVEDKEEIYSYLFLLNKSQELTDSSIEKGTHLTNLAFLKSIWKDEPVCEITHIDGSKVKVIPFKPTNVTGGGISVNFGGYDAAFKNPDDIEYSVGMTFKSIAPFNL